MDMIVDCDDCGIERLDGIKIWEDGEPLCPECIEAYIERTEQLDLQV